MLINWRPLLENDLTLLDMQDLHLVQEDIGLHNRQLLQMWFILERPHMIIPEENFLKMHTEDIIEIIPGHHEAGCVGLGAYRALAY